MNNTITIVGIGRVGATLAYTLVIKNLVSNLFLIDINLERCEGEVLDIADTLAFSETAHIKQVGYAEARNSDIIIIAAGFAQSGPEETRLELFAKNQAIVSSIMQQLEPLNPHAIVIVVTNPVDLMTYVAQQHSTLPSPRIFGTGTWLDTQRLRRYLGKELSIAPESIDAVVIGEHGDNQFVAWSRAHVAGSPIGDNGLNQKTLEELATKTKQEAYVIIKKKCATFFGIAACVADICESILFDQKRVLPVSCLIPTEGICYSVPVIVGKNGIERHLLLKLSEDEKTQLHESGVALKHCIATLEKTPGEPHS